MSKDQTIIDRYLAAHPEDNYPEECDGSTFDRRVESFRRFHEGEDDDREEEE